VQYQEVVIGIWQEDAGKEKHPFINREFDGAECYASLMTFSETNINAEIESRA